MFFLHVAGFNKGVRLQAYGLVCSNVSQLPNRGWLLLFPITVHFQAPVVLPFASSAGTLRTTCSR